MDRYHVNIFKQEEPAKVPPPKPGKMVHVLVFILLLNIFVLIYVSVESTVWNTILVEKVFAISNNARFYCQNRPRIEGIQERGEYRVFWNIVPARLTFECHETVTLTTTADVTCLGDIVPLVERWRGPISVAVYSPGADFKTTMEMVSFFRNCQSDLVEELVSFHVFYEKDHFPKMDIPIVEYLEQYSHEPLNCSELNLLYTIISKSSTYRNNNSLPFPINFGRNIARQAAETHYILSSDIDLYPSINFIPNFIKLIVKDNDCTGKNNVFVLPVFEVETDVEIPANKSELQEIYKMSAFPLHSKLCSSCRNIPMESEWIHTEVLSDEIEEFARVKQIGEFVNWELFYVGTHAEPYFDEQIFWEGPNNEMAFVLCLLDYDFVILDNAFLIHKPGIERNNTEKVSDPNKVFNLLRSQVEQELILLYGAKEGCNITYKEEE